MAVRYSIEIRGNGDFSVGGGELEPGLDDVTGTKTFVGGPRFARVRGDAVMRPTGANLRQTNMTYPFSFIDADGNVKFTKYVMRLDKELFWVEEWKIWLGEFMWGKYIEPGFGFQDTNAWPSDGVYKQQTIDCGLNVRKLVGEPFWTRKGQYVQVEAISYYSANSTPYWNYESTPHLMVKQTIVGTSSEQPVYYITHQKFGDLIWPNLFQQRLVHAMRDLELFPELPFETTYKGVHVTITGYCFQYEKVYGLINGQWYLLEESSGETGNAVKDRILYVSDWIETPPNPWRGWTLNKEPTLWERVVGYFKWARFVWTHSRDIPVVFMEDEPDIVEKILCFLMGVRIEQRSENG